MITRLDRRIALLLALGLPCYAPWAAASYAQMTLPGLGGMIMVICLVAYTILIDVVLLFRVFRFRAVLIVGTVISLLLLGGLAAEMAAFGPYFDLLDRDWEENIVRVSLVLLPLTILVAPVAQHVEARRHWPYRAAYAAIAVHALLLAADRTLAYFDDHPLESTQAERKALRSRGEQVKPGEIVVLLAQFEQRHAWGSTESYNLLKGLDDSALVHGNAPLPSEDRKALATMVERDRAGARPRAKLFHYYGFVDAKLLWDTLEPGTLERRFPLGSMYLNANSLQAFVDLHGPQRLCSVDGLAKTDRAGLFRALVPSYNDAAAARVNRSLDRLDEACRAASGAPRS